ncbi:aldehyde dehydrogenase family protein [Salinirussus salinus]|jgi:succinate-semialdehyde dehydrogenase/glutarate-semialdehyde dehydrogenase|uniref:aldehyde dehydrogenase family protein n=1 Tax=Salinirussus salinus TaxID=1198300 RepID=UPI00135AAF8C|nr:aldehyde dehydrogenase family protein [Salinirussus salinus]
MATGSETADDAAGEGHAIVTRNPATLEVNDEIPEADAETVEAAVADAAAAQSAWERRDIEERLAVLEQFRDLLLERKTEVAETATAEVGKPAGEAVGTEVAPALNAVQFLSEQGAGLLEEEVQLGALESVGDSTVYREPVGVVGMITPWNYPFGIPASEVVPTLFAGNAVVLKPAEETTLTAFLLRDLLEEAGLPADLLQVVPGRGEVTGQALAESGVDHLSFTGSTEVGNHLREVTAGTDTTVCLECGGSDPAIVMPDADLDLAADGILWARFANAGQSCAAVKRVYAHGAIEPRLRRMLVERVESLRVGASGDEGVVEVGPLISAEAVEKLHSQVERSVEMGAEVLTGGEPLDREGHFYAPTVLTGVTDDMPVVREETFGPVLPVMSYMDIDDAVERANDTAYGLTGSVWTTDVERGEAVARRIEAGTVTVNDHLYTFGLHATPWGGYKDTGGDFSHGRWGIESVTRAKHVHVAEGETGLRTGRFRDLWWFPYDENTPEVLGKAMEVMYGSGVAGRLRNAPSVLKAMLGER